MRATARAGGLMQDDESEQPPTLALGSAAPDFNLPGVDGKMHSLHEYDAAPVLVIVFTCNHCPTAQLYEDRIKKLAADYRGRGVALIAIQPNNPQAERLDELGYTDLGDSLAEMKIRAAYREFDFPYLYDGDTQAVAREYGPTATPHVFIFDRQRKLRYVGRVDNNMRPEYVTSEDARNAIEALLAGRPVAVPKTPSFGCSTKWMYKQAGRREELQRYYTEPVSVAPATADTLRALRRNPTGKLLLVNFWATWCGPCVHEFPSLVTSYWMYRHRAFDMVSVSANYPDARAAVLKQLEQFHASNRNYIFGTNDIYGLAAAFNPNWDAALPYTVLIDPTGKIVYERHGETDPIALRRAILANLPDDDYKGLQAYYREKFAPTAVAAGR
jgi:peroxiredoxin